MLEETEVNEEPTPPAPPKRRRRRRILAVLLLLFILLVGTGAGYVWWAMGGTANGTPVRVIIPEGASGSEIAAILQRAKVVRSGFIFRLVARLRGISTDLKPGAYDLTTGMGVTKALDRLRSGVPLEVFRITIPEGKTIPEIAAIVGKDSKITAAQFLAAVRSGRHRLPIMPKGSTNLEGLLFPKTYEIVEKTTADDLVDMMLNQFTLDTAGLDFSKAAAHHITPYQAVIVASLIEREAKIERDRPDDYTNVHSAYNTYLHDGLPPGPIASPGLAALQAALSPANTNYYYYVLTSDQRSHCFARDQAEFNRCRNAA
ncbi:MAG: endolytic transglycosylase MltG [Actinobacteria bacterium]|nr:MAG: endolytic transglycosylase MltG [Actinomycetota bacterium]